MIFSFWKNPAAIPHDTWCRPQNNGSESPVVLLQHGAMCRFEFKSKDESIAKEMRRRWIEKMMDRKEGSR
jgi:hypothetical protein